MGNADTFLLSQKGHATWSPIIDHLKATDAMCKGLPTYCQLHPTIINELVLPSDYRRLRPNGGCCEPCYERLVCGHSCPQMCHPIDREHRFIKCFSKCMRVPDGCPSNHPCDKTCWQKCGTCCRKVQVELVCGHRVTTSCHIASSSEHPVELFIATCGHTIQTTCYAKTSNTVAR